MSCNRRGFHAKTTPRRRCLNGLGMDPISADWTCSAIGCAVNLDQGDMSFDMELSGAKIDGSVVGLSNGSSNVHFMFSP